MSADTGPRRAPIVVPHDPDYSERHPRQTLDDVLMLILLFAWLVGVGAYLLWGP